MKDRNQKRWIMIVHSTGEDFNRVECGHRVLARDE